MKVELLKIFKIYFVKLIELLYTPKIAFSSIFEKRSENISNALVFASMSIFLSFGLLMIASHPLILDIKINWETFIKHTSLIPLQIALFVPIFSGIMHILAKLFKGKGCIKDSVVLVLYSYVLAPYAIALLVIFLTIEKMLGYPISLNPPLDPVLRGIEYTCEAALLLYGCYILIRGVEVAYHVVFTQALLIISSLVMITVLSGYGLTLLAYKILIS